MLDGNPSVQSINPSSLSFISAYISHIQLPCLLDTGATNSFIHCSMVRRLRGVPINKVKQRFTLADGNTSVNIIGTIMLNLRIGSTRTMIPAFVSKSLSHPCILGQDWLRKYTVDICQSTQQIVLHTAKSIVTIPMDDRIEQHHFPLKSNASIIIPP